MAQVNVIGQVKENNFAQLVDGVLVDKDGVPIPVGGDVSAETILAPMLENDAVRLVGDEFVDKNDDPIPGVSGYLWSQFAVLSPIANHGKYVRVSDVHGRSGYGGSTFVGDALGGWGQVSGPLVYAGIANAPDPTLWPGLEIFDTESGDQGGLRYISDGAEYVSEVPGLLGLKTDSIIKLICPNAAITWTASNNGSGKVRLTASGVHGLTTTPAQGAHLAATATQNGWTAGSFHEIAAIVSTTVIDLTTDWASQGVPAFALVGTKVDLYSLTVPVLLPNSYLEIDCCFTSSGLLTTNKNATIQLNGTYNLYNPAWNTAQSLIHPALIVMQNANSVSAQRGETITNNISGGSAQAGNVPADGSINTGIETTLTFGAAPTVNEWVNLRRARVMLKR